MNFKSMRGRPNENRACNLRLPTPSFPFLLLRTQEKEELLCIVSLRDVV